MTTLDTLARSSATAVHASVANVRAPVVGIAGVAQTAAAWRMAGYAVAGATAGVAVVFALLVAGPTADDPADTIVPTTSAVVPTSIPEPVVTPTTAPDLPTEEPLPVAAVPEDEVQTDPEPVDVDPPHLEVITPRDGEHLGTEVVEFSGRTEPGAFVVASGKFSAKVDKDGLWFVSLVLAPGANGVKLVATDQAGNETVVRLTVHLDVEVPEETTTTVSEWVFTANQKYGSCSEPVPYDVFSGQAQPGTAVTISSPYGGGTTTVNGDGKWSVRIEFPSAPYSEEFIVAVKDHTGAIQTFAFVSLYEG
jgi:hypothetical protein